MEKSVNHLRTWENMQGGYSKLFINVSYFQIISFYLKVKQTNWNNLIQNSSVNTRCIWWAFVSSPVQKEKSDVFLIYKRTQGILNVAMGKYGCLN